MHRFILRKCSPLVIFTIIICLSLNAQPGIEWTATYGGLSYDDFRAIEPTNDGGYITVGHSTSSNGDVTGQIGGGDVWLVKLDFAGHLMWQKCLGGFSQDFGNYIEQTNDGGYILAGSTNSNESDVSGNQGQVDFWVVKLDEIGAIQWQKCLGGTSTEIAWSCRQTSDGGYIVGGQTYSNDGNVTGNHGNSDCWLVKLNPNGQIQWSKTLGGTLDEFLSDVKICSDGGFIIAASSNSNDGDVSDNKGETDAWIVKLSNSGEVLWEKSFGGSESDGAVSVDLLEDGGFIVAAFTASNDGDVSSNNGQADNWIIKLDATGAAIWKTCIGGSLDDAPSSIIQTQDGGYVFAGRTNSDDGDIDTAYGEEDWFVAKLNVSGSIEWTQSFGGSGLEYVKDIYQTNDYGLVIAGYTASLDGNIPQNQGYVDAWIIKLANIMSFAPVNSTTSFHIYPNPANDFITVHTLSGAYLNEPLTLYNQFGQPLARGLIQQTENKLSIDTLPAGIYFLRIDSHKSQSAVFIKQ